MLVINRNIAELLSEFVKKRLERDLTAVCPGNPVRLKLLLKGSYTISTPLIVAIRLLTTVK